MIGLGSNRLTCCRRGGMSVTQAGRGGMEWLAGGRLPRWAQWWLPYSRQAGEALKDAFTAAQWETIRDYGWQHPEIVPYVNENPIGGGMLAMYGSPNLAFCLDGQFKEANAWKDVIGGVTYTNNGATSIDMGWYFDGSSKMQHSGGVLYDGATSTIEFVVRRTRVQAEIIFAAGGTSNNDSIWMVYRGGTQMHFRNKANYTGYADRQTTGLKTTSLNVNYGIENFIDLSTSSMTGADIGTTADSVLCSRNTGSTLYFKGDLYAIRIYNRLLTKEEMLAHQRMDNERFNLGLSPS